MDYPYKNENDQSDLGIAIQAGGKSSRMGTNKAKVMFQGQPLILRVVDRLKPLDAEMLIISNSGDLDYPQLAGILIYKDFLPDKGPLGGLYTALKYAKADLIAMVACDLPFVSEELIKLQVAIMKKDNSDVVIAETKNGLEPLHALYRRKTCLPAVETALQNGQRKVISWFSGMKVHILSEQIIRSLDPELKMFLNVNTTQELEEATNLEIQQSRINMNDDNQAFGNSFRKE